MIAVASYRFSSFHALARAIEGIDKYGEKYPSLRGDPSLTLRMTARGPL
jgi:hypothetical protein